MKKVLAFITVIVMTLSVFVISADAADNEWTVYARPGDYKEESEYESEADYPKTPGLRYTEAGLQFYTAEDDQLAAMNVTAYGTVQTKQKVSYKDGLSMTVVVDKYDDSGADRWISFSIWDSQNLEQSSHKHGRGWFCLLRPTHTECKIESWMCNDSKAMDLCRDVYVLQNFDCYDGEAFVFEIKKEGGKYNVYVNGIDMKASGFVDFMEDDEAYIGITGHQGVPKQYQLTITEFNGEKPTGDDFFEPYVPTSIAPRVEGEVIPGEPCYLFTFESIKDGSPGSSMTAEVGDDGTMHITFGADSPTVNPQFKKYLYDAKQFSYFAVLYKDLDEIATGHGSLWYCAGDVYTAQEGSYVTFMWSDGDYLADEPDGWELLLLDLTDEETWEGWINSLRFHFASDGSLNGETADVMWFGLFSSEKDAYYYADKTQPGYKALYDKNHPSDTEASATEPTVTESPSATNENVTDEPAADTKDQTADTKASADNTKDTSAKDDTVSNNKDGSLLIIIISAVVVVLAAAVIIILTKNKKSPDKRQ